jgi:hypothetical protein
MRSCGHRRRFFRLENASRTRCERAAKHPMVTTPATAPTIAACRNRFVRRSAYRLAGVCGLSRLGAADNNAAYLNTSPDAAGLACKELQSVQHIPIHQHTKHVPTKAQGRGACWRGRRTFSENLNTSRSSPLVTAFTWNCASRVSFLLHSSCSTSRPFAASCMLVVVACDVHTTRAGTLAGICTAAFYSASPKIVRDLHSMARHARYFAKGSVVPERLLRRNMKSIPY